MNRMQSVTFLTLVFAFGSAQFGTAVTLVDYNFNGGTDGQLVSGNTGGATAGTLNSSIDFPNTLIDATGGTATTDSRIKHWSDNPATETAGGNFVGLTYDTSLPGGAESRAGYDGNAGRFVRSGVLHNTSGLPHLTGNFSAFARIYWEDTSLYDLETLFSSSSRINQTGWWVGIDATTDRLNWSFNGPDAPMETPGATAPSLTPNTWTDIAVTFSGDGSDAANDTLKVYVDGALSGTYVGTASFGLPQSLRDDWSFWNSSTLQVGGSYRGSGPFQPEEFTGLMERFLLFDTVLTDSEIGALSAVVPEPCSSIIMLLGASALLVMKRHRIAN